MKGKRYNNRLKNKLRCLKKYSIGYNDSHIEKDVVKKLLDQNHTIAAAESCTGGLLVARLVNCSGVSGVLKESIITYSNEAKMNYLGVKKATLDTYGAVSKETAKEMAQGIRHKTNSTIGIATTGIAGPEGGTLEKPVGLVYIGIAFEKRCYVYRIQLQGTRQKVRKQTVNYTLYQLNAHLNQECTCKTKKNKL